MNYGRKPNVFALYRGDTFVDVGTLDELAARTGIKKDSLRFYATSVHRRRMKNPDKCLVCVRLEEDDDD